MMVPRARVAARLPRVHMSSGTSIGPIGALVLAALLFGSSFVVVKDAVADLPALTFLAWRFGVATLALFLLAPPRTARVWRDGAFGGLLVFLAFWAQTQALTATSATNSALVTGLYVILTPFVAVAWQRQTRLRAGVVLGTVIAFAGLALLTVRDGLAPAPADLLTLVAALLFAVHIVFVSRVAPRHPVVPFTAVQMFLTSLLAALVAWPLDGLPLPERDTWLAIALTGLVVSGGAFLLQIWAQSHVTPTMAAVVLAFEPAFATAIAAFVAEERLSAQGWMGAALIMGSIFIVIASERDKATPELLT